MTVYYCALALLAAGGAVIWRTGVSPKKNLIYGILAFLLLGGLSAVRYDVGFDYANIYVPLYFQLFRGDVSVWNSVHEPGFVLLEKALQLISSNYQILFVVTSALICGLLFFFYWKNTYDLSLAIILFVLLGQYYSSMNFIRQTLAAVIALFAIPFLCRRKVWRYLLLILLASTFHASALILIPFYWINRIPVNKYSLPIYGGIGIVLFLFCRPIVDWVTQFWYQDYHQSNPEVLAGFPVFFTLSAAAAFVLLFIGGRQLRSLNKDYYIYINYAFFTLLFVLLGTRIAILDRFSVYFEMAVPVGLSLLFHSLNRGRLKKYAAVLLGVIAVWGLSIHHYILVEDNHGVVPYACIFGQPSYQAYTQQAKTDPVLAGEELLERGFWVEPENLLEEPIDP